MKNLIEINIPNEYKKLIKYNDNKIIIDFIKIDKNKEMEDFFRCFLIDLSIVIKPEYPNSVFYKDNKNDEVIFELYQDSENKEKRYFYVHYDKIWSVFGSNFGLNYNETQSFIKDRVEDTLKLGSVTPWKTGRRKTIWWKIL